MGLRDLKQLFGVTIFPCSVSSTISDFSRLYCQLFSLYSYFLSSLNYLNLNYSLQSFQNWHLYLWHICSSMSYIYLFLQLEQLSNSTIGSDGKVSACNVGDSGSIPGLGRSPGEGNGNPWQYSCLEKSKDRAPGQATVHGVIKSQTWLSTHTHMHTHICTHTVRVCVTL